LAFQGGYERDESGIPTEDAELGAQMEAEFQAAVIELNGNIKAYFQGIVEAAERAKAKRPNG
jgi:hypothetical protein